MSRPRPPVLIERTLLMAGDRVESCAVEQLIEFQRGGQRMLLIAPRPRRWRPTRRAVDHDLAVQQQLHQLFSRAGCELDGVCYLPTGLFTGKSELDRELEGIARRYECNVSDLVLIGQEQLLLEGMRRAGGTAVGAASAGSGDGLATLARALRQVPSATAG
jgi:hypothetical protein